MILASARPCHPMKSRKVIVKSKILLSPCVFDSQMTATPLFSSGRPHPGHYPPTWLWPSARILTTSMWTTMARHWFSQRRCSTPCLAKETIGSSVKSKVVILSTFVISVFLTTWRRKAISVGFTRGNSLAQRTGPALFTWHRLMAWTILNWDKQMSYRSSTGWASTGVLNRRSLRSPACFSRTLIPSSLNC